VASAVHSGAAKFGTGMEGMLRVNSSRVCLYGSISFSAGGVFFGRLCYLFSNLGLFASTLNLHPKDRHLAG